MVVEGKETQPFFTIGLTTYNRRDLLRQTLLSILAQTFNNFEVIVGNDYTGEELAADLFGISDPRFRFVNHPQNLREVGNMNALLSMASGRYFTWLSDDDLYEPDFLRIAHGLLVKAGFPPGFFSSYRVCQGMDAPRSEPIPKSTVQTFSGRNFLGSYFAGRLKVISVYGLFDTGVLRGVVGGVEELCASGVGLYGEYIFLIRCALLEKIVYSDAPLVLYRSHVTSWGEGNVELDKYREAGPELLRRCGKVLRHPSLSADLTKRLLGICNIHLRSYASKLITVGLSRRNSDVSALSYGLVAELFSETVRTRRSFVEAGGVNGWLATLIFAWLRCKYSLLMVRILVVRRLKKS